MKTTNYLIVNGVMLPMSGALPVEELEMPLRVLGVIALVVLMTSAVLIVWRLTA